MNFEQARYNMVEQQIRTWEVLDTRVLAQFHEVKREEFVPPAYRSLAFADINVPLPCAQVMLAPKVEARILQALQIKPGERILEIGTGGGHLTALLAKLAGTKGCVHSVEYFAELAGLAAANLRRAQIHNVELITADACSSQRAGNYDVIVVGASLPVPRPSLTHPLAGGGRLLWIVGEEPIMEAQLLTRVAAAAWRTDSLFETTLPALIGAGKPAIFTL